MHSDFRERESISWWASRHGKNHSSSDSVRSSRRLTLLDILLLTIMTGLFIPWVLRMNTEKNLGDFGVRVERKLSGDEAWIVLRMRRQKSSEEFPSDYLIGWQIADQNGVILHEEWDIPPESGAKRVFTYLSSGEAGLRCIVYAGNESLSLPVEKDVP